VRLRQVLDGEYGIKVPSTGNRYPVDPVAIRSRVAERSAARGGDDE
jgi:S-DNA-T family DNA segregation ATPase FtsK/SpoIIIE